MSDCLNNCQQVLGAVVDVTHQQMSTLFANA
jgi:hypothetical protein